MRKPQRSSEDRCIVLHGVNRQYSLKRSTARATLALTVNATGLIVHAPWLLPVHHIERFVHEKASWIAEKLACHAASHPAEASWQEGMPLWYLGERVLLSVGAHIRHVRLDERVLYAPSLASADLKNAVLAWYRGMALHYFNARLVQFSAVLSRQPNSLKLSNARTRWGSCTPDGVVRLNWRLIQATDAEIDYVLAHELAHLTHMDHSAAFWRELVRIYPDYRAPHKLLQTQGHRYYQISL